MSTFRGCLIGSLMLVSLTASALAATGRMPATEGRTGTEAEMRALHCLALNIYFEARGEPLTGKFAVAHVVLNRVADGRFPRDICAVITQGGDKRLHRCQFSWWCDGLSDRPTNKRAWREARFVAALVAGGMVKDPTHGALWYHADYVSPYWAAEFKAEERIRIGRHIFYGAAAPETRLAGQSCRPSSAWTWSA